MIHTCFHYQVQYSTAQLKLDTRMCTDLWVKLDLFLRKHAHVLDASAQTCL